MTRRNEIRSIKQLVLTLLSLPVIYFMYTTLVGGAVKNAINHQGDITKIGMQCEIKANQEGGTMAEQRAKSDACFLAEKARLGIK